MTSEGRYDVRMSSRITHPCVLHERIFYSDRGSAAVLLGTFFQAVIITVHAPLMLVNTPLMLVHAPLMLVHALVGSR